MVFVYVLIALLGAAAMAVAVQNPDPVTISFLNLRTVSLPLSLLPLLSAFVGIVFASVSGFAREIELKLKLRQVEKRIVELPAPVNRTPRVQRGRLSACRHATRQVQDAALGLTRFRARSTRGGYDGAHSRPRACDDPSGS